MTKAVILFTILFSILTSSCHETVTTPPIDNLTPGRRDYTWKMDTLANESNFYICNIWGSDPNNLWGAGFAADPKECMWHYNGVKWEKNNTTITSNFSALFGVSANEIWAGDGNGFFYKYDGEWQLFQTLTMEGFNHICISCIWGTSSNNLFFCGAASNDEGKQAGIIGKFNGTKWELFNIPELAIVFGNIKFQESTGLLFLEALEFKDGIFTEMLFMYNFKELKLIASGSMGYYQLGYINGEVYFNINQKIYKYINSSLILWKDFSNSQYLGVIVGRSEKDFFGIGKNGEILHYNGNNWASLFQKVTFDYSAWDLFDHDFFSFAVDLETNERFILRGTLKQ